MNPQEETLALQPRFRLLSENIMWSNATWNWQKNNNRHEVEAKNRHLLNVKEKKKSLVSE